MTIQGLKTRYSTQKLTEFLLVAESEKQAMMGPSGLVTTGLFHIVDEAQTRFSDICPDGVTSLNRCKNKANKYQLYSKVHITRILNRTII